MSIQFKVLNRDDDIGGDTLVLGFPDESGTVLTLTTGINGVDIEDLQAFATGGLYTLAGVPMVPASHPAASYDNAINAPTANTLVPVAHAPVLDPNEAADAASAPLPLPQVATTTIESAPLETTSTANPTTVPSTASEDAASEPVSDTSASPASTSPTPDAAPSGQ